jgi:hypothetical protein
MNEYLYQLDAGACRDTFSLSNAALQHLYSTPPVSLEQDYYECTPTATNAFFDALGVAQVAMR